MAKGSKCQRCQELERLRPAGTHTYTANGVTHTHPDCPGRAS
jgi:hypothetical protein